MTANNMERARIRRAMENCATVGLLFLAAGVIGPLFTFQNAGLTVVFKWLYLVGAVVYTVARIVGAVGKDGTARVRRLRRMESWAGIAFCMGSFFWFYNDARYFGFFSLKVVSETITFTLVGALIQIIASWMLAAALKKQQDGK